MGQCAMKEKKAKYGWSCRLRNDGKWEVYKRYYLPEIQIFKTRKKAIEAAKAQAKQGEEIFIF